MSIRHGKKRVGRIVLQSLAIVLITLILAEIAFRVYDHAVPSAVFYKDSYNRFRGRPFAQDWDFKLNAYGFKDQAFSQQKGSAYRILGIGDSFAFGVVPYKHNYLTLIEEELRQQGLDLEIYNMGIPGAGPKDYLSLLVHEGLDFDPDMVLVSFFVGNDFSDSRRRKLYDYSYLASFFRYSANLGKTHQGRIFHPQAEYCDHCPAFPPEEFLKIESKKSFLLVENDPRFDRLFDNALHYLTRIRDLCQNRGIALVVLIIPDELQVNRQLRRELRESYYPNLAPGTWDSSLPNRRLAERLAALGIAHLDLYPPLSEATDRRLYRERDTHWNIEGNRFVANIVTAYLGEYLRKPENPTPSIAR